MSKQQLGAIGSIDMLTAPELREELGHHFSALTRQFYRADKFMRIPLVVATPSAGAVSFTSTVGPYEGYAWDIGFLGVAGLTGGTTPDVLNLLFDGGPTFPWWQFTGNAFLQRFSRGQLVMLPGEVFKLQSVGSFAATGPVTLYGSVRTEMPAEKLGAVLAL